MPAKRRTPDIERALAGAPRLDPGRSLIVGVSGGRDSVTLLHALVTAGFRHLIVCHLDHGLRGEEGEADAWFASELAAQYQLPFESDRVDVRELADEENLSLEAASRQARYEFYALVARAYWCPRIMLAHHADDQVETLLLNLFRGSGRGGLAGMAPVSPHEVRGARLEIHRPLLRFWREELVEYAAAHRLSHREDATNQERRFTRNRLRHDLLPILEEHFGREIKRALWRTATIMAAEEDYLAAQTPKAAAGPLNVADLKKLPLALQRRLIFSWLQENGASDLSFDDVEQVGGLLAHVQPAKINLAKNRHVRRTAGKLRVE